MGWWRLEGRHENWMFTKHWDEYASVAPIQWPLDSVLSGLTLEDIEEEHQARLRRGRERIERLPSDPLGLFAFQP